MGGVSEPHPSVSPHLHFKIQAPSSSVQEQDGVGSGGWELIYMWCKYQLASALGNFTKGKIVLRGR